VQVDVAEQVDRAGEERAGRHDHVPAAGPVAGGDGGGERLGAVGGAVPDGTEPGHREDPAGEAGPPHRGHDAVGGQVSRPVLTSAERVGAARRAGG
jgi:hypothetical protein